MQGGLAELKTEEEKLQARKVTKVRTENILVIFTGPVPRHQKTGLDQLCPMLISHCSKSNMEGMFALPEGLALQGGDAIHTLLEILTDNPKTGHQELVPVRPM